MSGDKNGAKMIASIGEHELKKCEKLFKASLFFCTLSCQNTANTSVFGWFALGGNTGIYETFSAPCQKKTSTACSNAFTQTL